MGVVLRLPALATPTCHLIGTSYLQIETTFIIALSIGEGIRVGIGIGGVKDKGSARGGSGVIVLPCGAGKTVVGIGAMARVQSKTLVLTTNVTALRQWRQEIIDKTGLSPHQVTEYSGEQKEIGPVTVTTYQILTYRKKKTDEERELAIRQIIGSAVVSEEVVDIFDAVGLDKPNIGILDDEFLAEVRKLPERNLAVERKRSTNPILP